jgi:fatty acid desaturase
MEAGAPPYRTNLLLTAAGVAVAAFQFVLFPVILLPDANAISVEVADIAAILVTVLLSLSTPFIRALLHEAMHGRLTRRRNWNDRLGRLLAICSGIAFDAIRLGHMTHHRYPRHALDRADVIEPGKSPTGAALKFYLGLFGWLYVREILSSMAMLLPRRAINWLAQHVMAEDDAAGVSLHGALRRGLDRRLGRIRLDSTAVIFVYASAFYLYGAWWPVLLMAVALRGFVVSLQDNVAHYGTPAVVGAPAHNSITSRWASLFLLNQNLHGVHHDHPEVPWNRLPVAFKWAGGGYAGGYFALLMKQFHGPLAPGAIAPVGARERH